VELTDGASGVRAASITAETIDSAMVRTVSHKSDNTYATLAKTSETYYKIHLGKGDEVADRSFNFDYEGTNIKSVSFYEYGALELTDGTAGVRAASITADQIDYAMVRTVSHKSNNTYATLAKTSETYYKIHLGKGDEVADRSFNFDYDGTNIKSVSFYEYGDLELADGQSGTRASAITPDTIDYCMTRTVSHKSNNSYATLAKTSETYYKIHLGKGDEIADRSFNFDYDGLNVKSVSFYEYGILELTDGTSGIRAASITASQTNFCMVRTVSHKSNSSYATLAKTSETYYKIHLGKGDEVADRSFNFDYDGLNVKSVSFYEYGLVELTDGASGVRAASITAETIDSAMVRTVSHKSDNTYATLAKTSETY
ncbi:MAG: hypothetical protein Q7L55_13300, partial [Actinomycetota bacterium]|nr:hypothetical protein [Actinomycetota bacterium]